DEQHHDAVDAGRHAAMGRRAILEGAVKPAEALLDRLAVEPDNLERLDHGLREMIADAAARDLVAVADHVVLERLDGQRILARQRLDAALRHGERVVAELDALLVLVPFVEGEIDDPAQFEAVAVDEVELLAGAGARSTCERGEFLRIAGGEEAGIAVLEAELPADRLGALLADILGDRAGANYRPFVWHFVLAR